MPKKIFLSFLGAYTYYPSRYYFDKSQSDISQYDVSYIQETLIDIFCKDWKPQDKFIVFTTTLAEENNWLNKITSYNPKSKETTRDFGKGLKFKLEQKNLSFNFDNRIIPDGENEEQMWEIFATILKEINLGDEIHLDITYSFRFIPTLSTVLLNYAKVVKKATVKGIYYGNYEVGKLNKNKSPIVDLTGFDLLQRWSLAVNIFDNFGVSDELVKAINISSNNDQSLTSFNESLSEFSKAIYTCRGHQLNTQIDIDLLRKAVEKTTDSYVSQLSPLVRMIEKKIAPFQNKTVLNGLSAVDWCIDHNLIQQGYTFLQETLKSYIVEKIYGIQHLNDNSFRHLAHIALNGGNSRSLRNILRRTNIKLNENGSPIIPDKTRELRTEVHPIISTYQKFTGDEGSRNDISHCGYTDYARTAKELEDELIELRDEIKLLNLT